MKTPHSRIPSRLPALSILPASSTTLPLLPLLPLLTLTFVSATTADAAPPKTRARANATAARAAHSAPAAVPANPGKKQAADLVASAHRILFPGQGRHPDTAEMASAAEKLTAACAADPKNADAPFLLGVIAEQRQDVDGAIKAYSRSIAADRSSDSAVHAALRLDVLRPLAIRLSDPAQAAKIHYASLIDQASAALSAGDMPLAISSANEAAALSSHRWEAPAIAGMAHLQLREYKEGLDCLTAARAAAPDAVKAALKPSADTCDREVRAATFTAAAQQKATAGDFAGASEQYIQAAALFPGRAAYRLEAANACALAHDYHRGLLLVKPLLNAPDPAVARRASGYDRQMRALARLDETMHNVKTNTDHQVAALTNPGADTDKMAQESQQAEDKIMEEANKRAEHIASLKIELQAALDRYKEYTGQTLVMGDLFSKSQTLVANSVDSTMKQQNTIFGAILKLSEIENKRKADSTKKEIDEMTAEIENLGGSVEYKDGSD